METHGKSPCTPRSTTPHLLQIRQRRKRRGVTQRYIDHAMVRESAHSRQRRALLSSSLRGGTDEDTNIFPVVSASLPLLASLVPEGFPLGREVAITGGNAKEEGVIFFKLVGGDEGDGAGLAGCVHLGEDLFGEGLLDSRRGKAGQFRSLAHREGVKCSLAQVVVLGIGVGTHW